MVELWPRKWEPHRGRLLRVLVFFIRAIFGTFQCSSLLAVVLFLFSQVEAVTHDKVVVISTSSAFSLPVSLAVGSAHILYSCFVIAAPTVCLDFTAFLAFWSSLLLTFVLSTDANFIAFLCFDSLVDFFVRRIWKYNSHINRRWILFSLDSLVPSLRCFVHFASQPSPPYCLFGVN